MHKLPGKTEHRNSRDALSTVFIEVFRSIIPFVLNRILDRINQAVFAMKISRYSIIIGVISLLSICAIVLSWGIVRKTQLDASSRQFTLDTTQNLFTNWAPDVLIDSSHSSFQQIMSEESLISYINTAKRLGSLDRMESISGSAVMSLNPFGDRQITANYEIQLTFGDNSAIVISDLVYEDSRWQFSSFRIQADLLTL